MRLSLTFMHIIVVPVLNLGTFLVCLFCSAPFWRHDDLW